MDGKPVKSGEVAPSVKAEVIGTSAIPEPVKMQATTISRAPATEKPQSLTLDAVANGFSTLVGALVGALVAYYLQRLLVTRQEEKASLLSAHKTIFSILQQINTILLIQRDYIHPYIGDPLSYISIRPTAPFDLQKHILSREDLSFLIETKDGRQIMYEIYMAQENYIESLNQWNLRSDFHIAIVQPALANAGVLPGALVKLGDIEKALGPLNLGTIQNLTENCMLAEQRAFTHLYSCKNKVRDFAARRFKTKDFTDYDFPELYGLKLPE